MSFYNKQHVFMVLAEYAFILRVIQMEKRKGDAARRTLSKSVKAVVAANQVIQGQGSQAKCTSISKMDFPLFNRQKCNSFLSFFLSSSPEGTILLLRTASTGSGSGAAARRLSNRQAFETGIRQKYNQGSPSNLIFPQHEFIHGAVNMLMMMSNNLN